MTDKSEKPEVKNSASENKEDEELSALLDSALEDFNTTSKTPDPKQSSQENSGDLKRPDPPQNLWDEEFLMRKFVQQTAVAFEQNLQSLFSPGSDALTVEQLGENIQRLAEAATQTAGFDASPDTEFSGIIAQTLKNLQENAQNLENVMNDEELLNLLDTFGGLRDSNSEANGLLPFMQQMMLNLLSKDILYPAISSIVEKYPQWLEDNKSKLSSADFERYTEQHKVMKEVCAELEKETPDDSQEVKTARCDQILALMQKVQDCGQPPAELVGDIDPMLRLDEHGNPQLPPNFSPSTGSRTLEEISGWNDFLRLRSD